MKKRIELETRRIQDEIRKIEDQKTSMTAAEKARRIEQEVMLRLEEETAKRGINININRSPQPSLSMNTPPRPPIASSSFSSSAFSSSAPSSSSSSSSSASDEKKNAKEDAKLAIFEIGAPPGPLGLMLLPFTIQLQVRQ